MDRHLSMLIFNLQYHKKSNSYLFFGVDVNSLFKIVLSSVRETDVVSFYEFRQIFILLPDTDIKVTNLIRDGLIKKLAETSTFLINSYEEIADGLTIMDARNWILDKIGSANVRRSISKVS